MKITVFYSWQSDLPNRTNRGFIEKALEKAIKTIRSSLVIEKDERPDEDAIIIDQDTQGMTGSPDIAHAIFDKIQNADIFVGDVSIINNHLKLNVPTSEKFRPTPNPNVLVELGYSANRLTWDNIICVLNLAYGNIDDLPFDLRSRRVLSYRAKEQDEVGAERDNLAKQLETALQAIVNTYEAKEKTSHITPLNALLAELEHNNQLASGTSWEQRGGKFRDVHYENIVGQGIFSALPSNLREQIRRAYTACGNANGFTQSVHNQRTGENTWATAVNQAEKAISEAKKKIDVACSELRKYLDSLQ